MLHWSYRYINSLSAGQYADLWHVVLLVSLWFVWLGVILSEGKDATEEFDDAGHSKSAKELMQDYFIGELDPTPEIPEMEVFRKEQDMGFASKVMDKVVQYWAIPAAVIGISAVIAILYARRKWKLMCRAWADDPF